MSSKPDINHILNETIKIAQRAGAYIRHEGANFNKSMIQEKGLNNLVSYVDMEAEKMIVNTLKFTMPEAGFITEEGTEKQGEEDYLWIVDPLDGTTNFMHGMSPHAVSIALQHGSKTLLGVVYEITHDECFYATHESKAYCNRKEIHVSEHQKAADGLFITGFPYTIFDDIDAFMRLMEHMMRHTHGLRRLGSAAADLAYVAAGRSEGFYEKGLHPWDIAAGALIVQQAGGKVSDFMGSNDYLFKDDILATNGAVHAEVLDIINKYLKK